MTTDYLGGANAANGSAQQSDGKIVLAGETQVSNSDFTVLRYTADGQLDSSFGYNSGVAGVSHIPVHPTNHDVTWGMAVCESVINDVLVRKIVAVGNATMSGRNKDFAVVRLNDDGSPDTSFGGGDGILTVDFGDTGEYARAVAMQSNGQIVVTGNSGGQMVVFRLLSDGTLDTTFGKGGKAATAFTKGGGPSSIVVLSDNSIVVAGGSNSDFALAKFTKDGALDGSFGKGGQVTTDFFARDDSARALTVQSDGKIIAAGYAGTQSHNNDFALATTRTAHSIRLSTATGR